MLSTHIMNRIFYLCIAFIILGHTDLSAQKKQVQKSQFPGLEWKQIVSPERMGFDSSILKEAKEFAASINSSAFMVIVDGKLVDQWGAVDKKYNTHSIRKSFLSVLYGKSIDEGHISMESTMEELGIDDKEGLSLSEKKATIRDCLKARSGIYHPALYETEGMKSLKPARFSERAGTHWYYNNWDFNVLGTIYEQKTNKKIFQAIEQEIAIPIGMQDYTEMDGKYFNGEESMHGAYPFRVTARDLARFGLLMLNKGKWKGKQLVSESWIAESTRYHSDATLYGIDGYGYMWWVSRDFNKFSHLPNVKLPEGTYSARGAGGHFVLIIPKYNMVIVHRVDTDIPNNRVTDADCGKLVSIILRSGNFDF